MVILGLMQNQWVRDPARLRQMYERQPDQRRRYIGALLFMACLSGQRLRAALGDWCDRIEWENASPEIVARASAPVAGDPNHVQRALDEVQPDVVVAFGRIAEATLTGTTWAGAVVRGPHPAARGPTTMEQLRAVRTALAAHAEASRSDR